MELLYILTNVTLLVLEASYLGPCFPFCILGIELLLKFPFKFIQNGDRWGSSIDIVTPTMPPNKSNILKREGRGVYLLNFIHDACQPKVGLELPKEVVDFPCVPCLILGWILEHISLWGAGHLGQSTIAHHHHTNLKLGSQGFNPCFVCLDFSILGGLGCFEGLDLLVDISHHGVYHRLHQEPRQSLPWTLAP